ncbi:MAG: sulfatase-like hydrolase/transferase [Deltaproteobacteria bacterium]|nr:sulfatase-like hydrolase/transferase [Deltaproteobacteria bacterium]
MLRITPLFLLLFYPFFNFISFNQYPWISSEVLVLLLSAFCLAVLGSFVFAEAAGFFLFLLITGGPVAVNPTGIFLRAGICLVVIFFLHLLKKRAPIVVLIFIVGAGVTEFFIPGPQPSFSEKTPLQASNKIRGNVLYIILDEHIGIDGMPPNVSATPLMQKKLTDFYLNHNFTLYPKAYSPYFYTDNAVPNALNGTFESIQGFYFKGVKRKLEKNRLFERYFKEGYRIYSYAPTYIDYCTDKVFKCTSYPENSPVVILGEGYGVGDRLLMLTALYSITNSVFHEIQKRIPEKFFLIRMGPLKTVPSLFRELKKDIQESKGDALFFAHVLMPHSPYVYDAQCQPKPLSGWLSRKEFNERDRKNSEEGYRKRYAAYYEQMECVHLLLADLFEFLKKRGEFDSTTIFVHGDHGSRIILDYEPYFDFAQKISRQDMLSSHSALLAVKLPGQKGAINPSQGSLPAILNAVFDNKPFEGEAESFVLMKQKKGKKALVRHPMPPL